MAGAKVSYISSSELHRPHDFVGYTADIPASGDLAFWGSTAQNTRSARRQEAEHSNDSSNMENFTSIKSQDYQAEATGYYGEETEADIKSSKADKRDSRSSGRSKRNTRQNSSDSGEDSKDTRRRREKKGGYDNFEKPDAVTAAKNKASRERQRRERLNDSFNELTKVMTDPGKYVKAEKPVIIADTIKLIGQLRQDNEHLAQDKHQLQDHVNSVEKDNHELVIRQQMLERELEQLRLSVYPSTQRVSQNQGMVMSMDVNSHTQNGGGGLAQMFQQQARVMQQGQIPLQQQQNIQANHNPGALLQESVSQPMNTSFGVSPDLLDLDMGLADIPDLAVGENDMSTSPMWWNTSSPVGRNIDASYMCSGL